MILRKDGKVWELCRSLTECSNVMGDWVTSRKPPNIRFIFASTCGCGDHCMTDEVLSPFLNIFNAHESSWLELCSIRNNNLQSSRSSRHLVHSIDRAHSSSRLYAKSILQSGVWMRMFKAALQNSEDGPHFAAADATRTRISVQQVRPRLD